MSQSFDFRHTTRFTTGTIGQPGRRLFFLQVGDQVDTVTVKLEKQQVRALAQFLRTVLDDLPSPSGQADPVPLIPTEPDWVVGQIAVGVDEADGKVVLVLEELVADEDEESAESTPTEELDWDEPSGARIRAHVDVDLAAGFVAASDELMASGRPPCSLCGQPMDPGGHACPRLN